MTEYWAIKVNRQGQTVVYYYGLCIVPVSCDRKNMACKRGEVTSVEGYVWMIREEQHRRASDTKDITWLRPQTHKSHLMSLNNQPGTVKKIWNNEHNIYEEQQMKI